MDAMKPYNRLLKLLVQSLFTPFVEFTRIWENDQFGQRLVRVLIELVALVHLLTFLAPHL